MRGTLVALISASILLTAAGAKASPEREFIMSCTYGVLAGTLVGAASLAFVDEPGQNLQRVARGASLGLYMGIGLGIYTVYILPKQLEKEENKLLEGPEGGYYESTKAPKFMLMPFVDEGGSMGVFSNLELASF